MVLTQPAPPETPESRGTAAPGLTVAAVARRLGVAPATLRTWDRRYGLGPTERSAGSHRRYSAVDVARLDLMRRLVNTGVPPGDAARHALAADVVPDLPAAVADPGPSGTPTANSGGGNVVPLPDGSPQVRGLARAAMSLDSIACIEIVRETIDARGVVWTWDELVSPVLIGIGRRWEATGAGIEVEHVLSESVRAALTGVVSRLRAPVNPRPVLLCCAPQELHSLPLFAVAAALSERHVGSRVLGARMPHEALVNAVRRTGPSAVLVWAATPETAHPDALADLPSLRPAPTVLAAGPGWSHPLPASVGHVTDLVGAVARITRATTA